MRPIALKLIVDLRRTCAAIEEMPLRFPLVPHHEARGLRRLLRGHYLIFYKVERDAVQIVRIFHGVMNYEAILFPTD